MMVVEFFLLQIVREFKFYSTLRHKNIVEVHELYIDFQKDKIYMVMELVRGSELFQLLDKGNLLTGNACASNIRMTLNPTFAIKRATSFWNFQANPHWYRIFAF